VSEVNILRELSHPSIVKYYDRIIDKEKAKIYIIMEYCNNGDLQKVIKSKLLKKDSIDEDFIWKVLTQIVSGLESCHNRKDTTHINNGANNTKNHNSNLP
jgi:NIMA (never in mitosis gene a)-related kinase